MLNKIKSVLSLTLAILTTIGIFRQNRPDAVIGVGGYGSLCGGIAAKLLGIPVFLQEQNTVPGRVNRLLSRFAERAFVQWPLMRGLHKNCNVDVIGSPIRQELLQAIASDPEGRTVPGLDSFKTTLLVMGGSQGASSINQFILSDPDLLGSIADRLQIIHITGDREFETTKAAWEKIPMTSIVMPFCTDMASAYNSSDFVLCRAGATTVAEALALAKPMALVPLPSAADNHQEFNAKYIEACSAGVMLQQSSLSQPGMLRVFLTSVVLNDRRREILAANAKSIGVTNAATIIATSLITRFGVKTRPMSAESMRRLSSASAIDRFAA